MRPHIGRMFGRWCVFSTRGACRGKVAGEFRFFRTYSSACAYARTVYRRTS